MALEGVLDEIVFVVGGALVLVLGELLEDLLELPLYHCSLPDLLRRDGLGVSHVFARERVLVVVAEVRDQLHEVVALLPDGGGRRRAHGLQLGPQLIKLFLDLLHDVGQGSLDGVHQQL